MKKFLLIILIALVLSLSLYADSFSSFGMSGIYDNPLNYFELGFYTNYYYTFPLDSSPINLGFGSRLDLSFSIPIDTFSFAFLSGFVLDAELSKRADLYFMLGPQVSIITPSESVQLLGIGGGLDVGLTYYFDDERTLGASFGIANYFSAIIPEVGSTRFGYYGGVYIGLSARFASPEYTPLPPGYSYIDYVHL